MDITSIPGYFQHARIFPACHEISGMPGYFQHAMKISGMPGYFQHAMKISGMPGYFQHALILYLITPSDDILVTLDNTSILNLHSNQSIC
jgi:hypothetical protein